MTTSFTLEHDGVRLALTRGGHGEPLVLIPGLASTQADLAELAGLLRRDHDVLTFDLRGHGLSADGDDYSFAAFLGDLGAVVARAGRKPLLVGHSLGADLAVHHAAAHPGTLAGLVLVDGGNPVPEPFLTEADLPEFRAMWESLSLDGVRLGAGAMVELNLEVDRVRADILDRYLRLDLPIRMIMSTRMAGDGDDEATRWRNANWRAGVDRLLRARPETSVAWVEADHRLPITHAREVARLAG